MASSFLLHVRYYINLLSRRAQRSLDFDALSREAAFPEVYQTLRREFESFDPGAMDGMKQYYAFRGLDVPTRAVMNHQAAYLSALYVLALRKLTAFQIPPMSLMPLVSPQNATATLEKVQKYLEWMSSTETQRRQLPLPFFYSAAVELLRHQQAQVALPAMASPEAALQPA